MFCISKVSKWCWCCWTRDHLWELLLMTIISALLPREQWANHLKWTATHNGRYRTLYQTCLFSHLFCLLIIFLFSIFPKFTAWSCWRLSVFITSLNSLQKCSELPLTDFKCLPYLIKSVFLHLLALKILGKDILLFLLLLSISGNFFHFHCKCSMLQYFVI